MGLVRTGAFAYLQYQFEMCFGTPIIQACLTKPIGFEPKISGWTWTNNRIPLSQLNSVQVQTYAYGQARGNLGLDFVMSNPWWLEFVFDTPAAPGGCACMGFVYSYLQATQLANSATMEIGIDLGCAGMCDNVTRTINGVIANTATVRSSVGEVARVSLDLAYANDLIVNTVEACPFGEVAGTCMDEHIPFTFANGTLTFGIDCGCCATVEVEVQSVDLTINPNSELLYEHGCHHATNVYRRLAEYTGTFSASLDSRANLDRVYAQIADNAQCIAAEMGGTMILDFDNGLMCDDQRQITFTMTGLSIGQHSTSIEPNEPIWEDIEFQGRNMTVSASNDNTTPP